MRGEGELEGIFTEVGSKGGRSLELEGILPADSRRFSQMGRMGEEEPRMYTNVHESWKCLPAGCAWEGKALERGLRGCGADFSG